MTEDEAAFLSADRGAVVAMLHQGLALVAELSTKLQSLDDLMLAGRPQQIAGAASEVESALSAAEPTFANIADTMKRFGTANLQSAAEYLRHAEQDDAASLAELSAPSAQALRSPLGAGQPARILLA